MQKCSFIVTRNKSACKLKPTYGDLCTRHWWKRHGEHAALGEKISIFCTNPDAKETEQIAEIMRSFKYDEDLFDAIYAEKKRICGNNVRLFLLEHDAWLRLHYEETEADSEMHRIFGEEENKIKTGIDEQKEEFAFNTWMQTHYGITEIDDNMWIHVMYYLVGGEYPEKEILEDDPEWAELFSDEKKILEYAARLLIRYQSNTVTWPQKERATSA